MNLYERELQRIESCGTFIIHCGCVLKIWFSHAGYYKNSSVRKISVIIDNALVMDYS